MPWRRSLVKKATVFGKASDACGAFGISPCGWCYRTCKEISNCRSRAIATVYFKIGQNNLLALESCLWRPAAAAVENRCSRDRRALALVVWPEMQVAPHWGTSSVLICTKREHVKQFASIWLQRCCIWKASLGAAHQKVSFTILVCDIHRQSRRAKVTGLPPNHSRALTH